MTEKFNIVLESIGEYLKRHIEARAEATKKEQEERRKELVAEKRRQAAHKLQARRNLPYAERIFSWVAQFRESETGKQAIAAIPTRSRPDKALAFFTYRRGYNLSTTDHGIDWYRYGPGSARELCTTPEQLARCTEPPGMLEAACKAIESGEVWQWIQEDLDCFRDKAQ
jgi:hypothetical protein